MIILIQNNKTGEVETIRAEDLGIGIHENWSMISYTDDKGVYICRTVYHDKYYISCITV